MLLTEEDSLINHIKKLGTVTPFKQIKVANKILEQKKDFDLVVMGPPFGEKDKNQIEHSNVFVVNQPEDIAVLFRRYSPPEKPPAPARKLKSSKADINYAEAQGRVLLITTDKAIVEELNCFDIRVATNLYSAKRLINSEEFDLVVVGMKVTFKSKLPTYKWDIDILTKKDVYLLLTTGRLSLETVKQ